MGPRNATRDTARAIIGIASARGKLTNMVVLGIETTCDETAAALVERRDDGGGKILSDIVLSQTDEHAAFGGVVPEIAARAHVEAIDHVIAAAMKAARMRLGRGRRRRGGGGAGPDRRRHRRLDHRQGARAGATRSR